MSIPRFPRIVSETAAIAAVKGERPKMGVERS